MNVSVFERKLADAPSVSGGYVIVDLETSGLDPRTDAIIQVAALKVENETGFVWSSLVRPNVPVPDTILRLTRIATEDLQKAPPQEDVLAQLSEFIGNRPVVGHHIDFDLAFLGREGLALRRGLDTLTWARIAFPRFPSHRLEELTEVMAWPISGTFHDARTDVAACLALLVGTRNRLSRLSYPLQQILAALLVPEWSWWHLPEGPAIADTPLLRPAPEGPDPNPPKPLAVPAQPIADWFVRGGGLASRHPGWQPRPGQVELANALEETIARGETLLAEAETGIGKSLAYLIPTLMRAASTGERVVIATHTLALQDQLWQKDLPEAMAALDLGDMPVALLKGRSRYLCLLKTEEAVRDPQWLVMDPEERTSLGSLLVWLAETADGERDDWTAGHMPGASDLWNQVAADPDACAGARCRFAGPCFLRQSRRQADTSALVVTNHALLLSNAYHGGTLPPYQHLVVDEAHRIPDVADQVLGFSLALGRTARQIRDWAGEHGALSRVSTIELIPSARLNIDHLKALADAMVKAQQALGELRHSWLDSRTFRLTEEIVHAMAESGALARIEDAQALAMTSTRHMADFMAQAGSILPRDMLDTPVWLGLARMEGQIYEMSIGLADFGHPDPDWVDWWEVSDRAPYDVTLRRAPLDPATLLREHLWEKVPGGTALLSATLAVGGRFDYAAAQLGLPHGNYRTLALPSPFDVRGRALLAIPEDFPDPRSPQHVNAVRDFVLELARRQNGRMLVLTTSRRALHDLAAGLQSTLDAWQIQLLVQGRDGPVRRLAKRLWEEPQSVLLGTASLWEGIDVPGPSLSAVVVTRLPFGYPGDPLEEARRAEFDNAGRSFFRQRTLPQAVLRFRQGFGRLLRTVDDRGTVVVLDPRILPDSGRYGQVFLKSLPGPRLIRGTVPEVMDMITRFAAEEDDWLANIGDQ